MDINALGWDAHFETHFAPHRAAGLTPGRVAREDREHYRLWTEAGPLTAAVAGRFRHETVTFGDFPAVGDWVAAALRPDEGSATIHAVLPRRSAFRRTVAGGRSDDQVVAANVDRVFLMTGLDGNFRLRRIERYLTVAWGSGAGPVVVLSKADLCLDVEDRLEQVKAVAADTPVHAVSATEGTGLDELEPYLQPAQTVALMGSSGVGKSTLINALLGAELLATRDVREADSRGRHMTTHRELVVLPGGALLIDTPGMRELGLWGEDASPDDAFADVEALARECRFSDCSHNSEPGCAVQQAIGDGVLEVERYDSYLKLGREARSAERRYEQKLRMAERAAGRKKHDEDVRRERRRRRQETRTHERRSW
jgi:ribosome biogenesis GTPase